MDNYENAFVHPFKAAKCHYLYDVNTNCIIQTSKEIHDYYKKNQKPILKEQDSAILAELYKNGFLMDNPISEIEHTTTFMVEHFLERKVQGITLQMTQQCNLRCKYCVYSGQYLTREHSSKSMPLEMAKKSIDFLIDHSTDIEEIDIAFYGGEPLLKFKEIKEIVDYVKTKCEGKKYRFNITTNGTLYTDEILKFLTDNNFIILMSLDGPKEIHDSNRVFANSGKGTFDVIMKNIKYIKECYPELFPRISFNAVFDPRLDQSCANDFFVKSTDLDPSRVYSSLISEEYNKEKIEFPEEYFILTRRDTYKLYLHKIGRLSKKYVSPVSVTQFEQLRTMIYLMRGYTKRLPNKLHPSGPCIPGARKLFIDINGNFYPCERVSENSCNSKIGSLSDGFYKEKILKILNVGKITEEQCKKCWGIRFCQQCFSQSDDTKGLSKKKRLSICPSNLNFAEDALKDFCVLNEYGYAFGHNEIQIYSK